MLYTASKLLPMLLLASCASGYRYFSMPLRTAPKIPPLLSSSSVRAEAVLALALAVGAALGVCAEAEAAAGTGEELLLLALPPKPKKLPVEVDGGIEVFAALPVLPWLPWLCELELELAACACVCGEGDELICEPGVCALGAAPPHMLAGGPVWMGAGIDIFELSLLWPLLPLGGTPAVVWGAALCTVACWGGCCWCVGY